MSARQIGDRAAHVEAFALLVKDGLIEKRTVMTALMRRDYFTPPTEGEATKEPGYNTARGNAFLIDNGSLTYSEGTYLVARTIRANTRIDIEYAMLRAERLLARTLTEIDEHRKKAGGEIDAAMRRLEGPTPARQLEPAPAPAQASVTAMRRQGGPTL